MVTSAGRLGKGYLGVFLPVLWLFQSESRPSGRGCGSVVVLQSHIGWVVVLEAAYKWGSPFGWALPCVLWVRPQNPQILFQMVSLPFSRISVPFTDSSINTPETSISTAVRYLSARSCPMVSLPFSRISVPFTDSSINTPETSISTAVRYLSARSCPVATSTSHLVAGRHCEPTGREADISQRFHRWLIESLNIQLPNRKNGSNKFKSTRSQDKNQQATHLEMTLIHGRKVSAESFLKDIHHGSSGKAVESTLQLANSSLGNHRCDVSANMATSTKPSSASLEMHSLNVLADGHGPHGGPSLSIAVIGATGELARRKIFPALFALYYNGFLPENVGIFGYSRKNLTDEDLRALIASTLTCRIDHQENCGDKMEAFLRRTYYLNGGYDNREGMSKLNSLMEHIEEVSAANRIFYLSVPQESLLDVASSLADNAQTQSGWNRIIIEKPFGFNTLSSHQLTRSLLSKFEENQIYRIDHLLGKNLIENLTVLRFSNLVFEPLWSRAYIRNVQIILSEDLDMQTGRYFEGYGIIRDIIHSHILQTIALLAMEPPVSLHGEDIRNEKIKVLRSIRQLDPNDVILGQYKASSGDKVDVNLDSLTPTYFAAALYIDNPRWDGVPILIKAGMGLIKHRVEIRIQFHHVPGNIYRERIGHNIDRATNELILRDVPDEAILIKVNNKIPGLGLQLDASELNLLYKDRYNVEVPDSYEHLLLDVIDGDNHLFMRSDELAAAWNILNPVLEEIDRNNISPELYELGGRGPVGAYYLWAKHEVPWADD